MAVEQASGEKIDNVVFMGMGEPLANLTNLKRANLSLRRSKRASSRAGAFGRLQN